MQYGNTGRQMPASPLPLLNSLKGVLIERLQAVTLITQ